MASHGHSHGEYNSADHAHPPSMYVKVLIALILLMGLTVWASTWNLGSTVLNNILAMTIAVVKATLVVLYFMNVKFSTKLTQFWAIVGFTWVTLMTFILVDYGTRRFDPSIAASWNNDPGSAMMKDKGEHRSESNLGRDAVNVRLR